MSVAETASLLVKLSLADKMTPGLKKAEGSMNRLGSTAGKVGRGIKLGLGAAAVGGVAILGKALSDGISALKEDAVVAASTAAVIKSTGAAAGYTAKQIGDMAESLSVLNGVDDNTVQQAENVLLTFTKVGKDIFPAVTQAALDMSAQLGGDVQSSIIQLGKALQDPATGFAALKRAGVSFDATQISLLKSAGGLNKEEMKYYLALTKTDKAHARRFKQITLQNKLQKAQALILKEVQREFDGVAKAQADADPSRRFAVALERLQKRLASGLLPVLNKVTERLTDYLGRPETLATVQKIGDAIAGLFTDQNLDTAAKAIETAAGAVSGALTAFNKLPPEIKALAIGALTLNKVTGGAVGGAAEAFGKLIGSGLKQIFAGQVTVIGGSVTGAGGGGGGGVAPVAGGGGKLATATKVLSVAAIAAEAFAVFQTQQAVSAASTAQSADLKATLARDMTNKTPKELQKALDGVNQGIHDLQANPLLVLVQGDALTNLQEMRDSLQSQLNTNTQSLVAFRAGERDFATANTLQQTANARLAAIAAKRTQFTAVLNVVTNVSVREMQRQARYTSRAVRSATQLRAT